jgi:hypothetical protein
VGSLLLALLCTAGAAGAAPDTSRLPGAKELRGSEILGHPVGQLAINYSELVHAGRMEEALALATANERERARSQSRRERAHSDRFKRKVLPSPERFTFAIEHGGVLSIHGPIAFLEVVTTIRLEEPDGTVTSSSTTLALPFSLEDGQWRVAG